MRQFRVYFIKNGIKLTKLVYADSLLQVFEMFKDLDILMVREIDNPEFDIEIIHLN